MDQDKQYRYIKNYEILIKRANLSEYEYPLGESAFNTPAAIKVAKRLIGRSIQERFLIFMYDDTRKIIGYADINKGSTNRTNVDMHSCLRTALIAGANFLCLCHNHPNGNLSFSEDDVKTTKVFISAGKILGIEIMDHILVNDEDGISMRERIGEEKWIQAQLSL